MQPEIITGKPISIGGSLGRTEATGRGVAITVREACQKIKYQMNDATVVVQGFGNAGQFAAKLVEEQGAKIIAVSDTKGAIINKNGLKVDELINIKKKIKRLMDFHGSTSNK